MITSVTPAQVNEPYFAMSSPDTQYPTQAEPFNRMLNNAIHPSLLSPQVPGFQAGAAVAGNSDLDGNKETQNFGNEQIWRNGSIALPVRCLANDNIPGSRGDAYFCDDMVSAAGGLEMLKNPDGTITAIGRDFISPESGLYYKFMGFRSMFSKSPLMTDNVYTLEPDQQKEVFRAYWKTCEVSAAGPGLAATQAAATVQTHVADVQKDTLNSILTRQER